VSAKLVKNKASSISPLVGSGLLCDSVNVTDAGRITAQGLITLFWAWGYPCVRSWFLVLTLFHLPKGKTPVTISMRKIGQRDQTSLAVLDTDAPKNDTITTMPIQLSHSFDSPGRYELICNLQGAKRGLKIPFVVLQKEWVEFSDKEKEYVKTHLETPHTLRANVHCRHCNYAYIFEESVIDDMPAGGVHRFPRNGEFECADCGHILKLKDIQGQLRASLKDMLTKAMRKSA
jgi:hypothetical protein